VHSNEADGWTRWSAGRVVHADSTEHVHLVAETLGIDVRAWAEVLDRYAALVEPGSSVAERLQTLRHAFCSSAPYTGKLPELEPSGCACCRSLEVRPVVVRKAATTELVYGRCGACGHGQLLRGAAEQPYLDARYYQERSRDGSGYQNYQAERDYREAKAKKLLGQLEASGPGARSLLEVGSGFGYTRNAAESRGLKSAGVDVNPEAARAAKQLYGFETLVCRLGEALASGALQAGVWELVLYQFVLEHLADPAAELVHARRALAPGGRLVLVVPSMSSFELDVFGASYRSLRGDHLHLFSPTSLERFLSQVGLEVISIHGHCNLSLVRGFFEPIELSELYAAERAPDLTVVAQRTTA
jgi:SAM-dependent methyltransferase